MEDDKTVRQARVTFETMCRALDQRSIRYQKDEEKLWVRFGVRSDGLPVDILLRMDVQRQLVILLSQLPFRMSREHLTDGALAVTAANFILADGSFDYNLNDGGMMFRLTASFRDSMLGEGLFEYMMVTAVRTVDRFSDRLLMLSKGRMTLDEFIEEDRNAGSQQNKG